MLFNSYTFAVFYILVYVTYFGLRKSYQPQNWMLLFASYVFYGWWDIRFLFLIVMTTAADFCYGLMIGKGRVNRRQRVAVSLLMLSSAFFFVMVKWSAVRVDVAGQPAFFNVDWSNIVPGDPRDWWVLLVTMAVVTVLNILYPWFETFSERRRRISFLVASLVTNLGTLAFFKYFNFFAESFRELASTILGATLSPWTLAIVLPVGVSFFTFQSLSYTIDVYKRKIPRKKALASC